MDYIGILFKKKAGGLICYYSPNDDKPSFWYFKAGDSIQFITKKMLEYVGFDEDITVHINKIQIKNIQQLATYHEFMGMLASMNVFKDVTYRIVPIVKCRSRIMSLLHIHKKKDFSTKFITTHMHNNQYNYVWEKTNMMSQQSITHYKNAYILSYYGYLKDVVKVYNHKMNKIGEIYGKKFINKPDEKNQEVN